MGLIIIKSRDSADYIAAFSNRDIYMLRPGSLGASEVDIPYLHPPRLLITYSTEGFTLQHLRFLVLDEADRLLGMRTSNVDPSSQHRLLL
jgi:hypothetical protein